MKTILIINDQTPEAEHAAAFALVFAQKTEANIILATHSNANGDLIDDEWGRSTNSETILAPVHSVLMKKLLARKKSYIGFSPLIQEIEVRDEQESLVFLTTNKGIYMVVKGIEEFIPHALINVKLCISALLNKLQVPLLLIPSSWSEIGFKRLVYLTDLRFCGIQNVRFLAELAGKWKASLVIAHSKVSGLPEIEVEEAEHIFSDAISLNIKYGNLFLNILEQDNSENVLEVMVSQMHAELLVLVNQHFHFHTLTKQYFKDGTAIFKPVPLLIFPA
ncbi:hypothetical protein EZJ43_08170 [Pedobacter changchengzhani]|uniref:Universal stress protein n=1 Tax=Pedobacter changchengzhani TaxID=2529274 RepID=A0A4R5MLB4_9SPHI|nr:hypothetical protein [Pedobacter changchengzhani]TDG36484.1 hypothetical protein EZJ43_08170 [Pedobacter changchengzhani]